MNIAMGLNADRSVMLGALGQWLDDLVQRAADAHGSN